MSTRDSIRLVSQKDTDLVLKIDAESLSSSPELFCVNNKVNYDLAINTWLISVHDYAPYTWTSIHARIVKTGLVQTVKYFTDAATSYLRTGEVSDFPLAHHLLIEVERNFQVRSMYRAVYSTAMTPSGIFLFLCRYLKRFTPLHADKLEKDAVNSFLSNQNRLKMLCRRGYSPFIMNLLRDEVDTSLLKRRARLYASIKMVDVELTPGTCYSLAGVPLRTMYDKYNALVAEYHFERKDILLSSVWNYELGHTARLMTVPKTLTSARTIAPEECLRQAVAHRMFTLRLETPEGINLQDQSINQEYALQGSLTGEWCTIDLSHASDDVTWSLVQSIYQDAPYYLRYLDRIRPSYIDVSGKRILLQSFATMGNSMTFLVESEVFWIITRAAVHFAQRHGIECSDTVVVYGDDIICDSKAYPYVVAFLSKCGFSINESKSYYDGVFRESCGKDYLDGEDVSSPYFPRRSMKTLLDWARTRDGELITVAESLIALQHRLYDVSPRAAQYIELFIREHKADLGIEPAGTETTDIWGLDLIAYATSYTPEWTWVYGDNYVWKLRGTRWVYEQARKLKRTYIEDEAHKRLYQLRPTVQVDVKPINEELLYNLYLSHGPWYATPLDALLGISTSRRLMPTGAPHSVWKRIER